MEIEKPKPVMISSHTDYVRTICFSPDQKKLCSGGEEQGMVRITNLEDKTEKKLNFHTGSVYGSSFSSDGQLLATSSDDQSVQIWKYDSEEDTYRNTSTLKGHIDWVWCVKFFNDEHQEKIVSCCDSKEIKIWDIEKKKEIISLKSEYFVYCIDVLPRNQSIFVGDEEGDIQIWDYRSAKLVKSLKCHESTIYSLHLHPNSFSIVSGSKDKTVKIGDLRTYRVLRDFGKQDCEVNSVHFHPSGKYFISGSDVVNIFESDSNDKKAIYSFDSHQNSVECVKFSPNGMQFASGACDFNVFLWNFQLGKYAMMKIDRDEEERARYLAETIGERRFVCRFVVDNYITLFCFKSLL